MTDVTYRVKLDISDIKSKAAEIQRTLSDAFKQVGQSSSADNGALKVLQEQARAATEAEKQLTQSARASSVEREQAARAESQERIQIAKATASGQIEEEKRVTAQVKAEIQTQAQAARQAAQAQQQVAKAARASGGGGGIGGAVLGAAASYLSIQGARMVVQQAAEFSQLGTQVRRTEAAFRILSGSAGEAEARINAVKTASGGTVTELKAMEISTLAAALGLANTAKGIGDLVSAGREITLVSASIHDVQDAIVQLSQFSNSATFARADQLGLDPQAVKERIKQLQEANSGLSDSQAKLAASIQLLHERFGTLLSTEEAQAGGVEKLGVAFSDLWAKIAAGPTGQEIDKLFGGIADGITGVEGALKSVSGNTSPREQELRAIQSIVSAQKDRADVGIPGAAGQVDFYVKILAGVTNANTAIDAGIPGAQAYKDNLLRLGEVGVDAFGNVTFAAKDTLKVLEASFAKNPVAIKQAADAAVVAAKAAAEKARAERIDNSLNPIVKISDSLKDNGLENFFQKIQDGLSNSADLAATATNRLQAYRDELEAIARTVANDQNGVATPAQQGQVDALNAQINTLKEASKLYDEFKKKQLESGGGDAITKSFDQLNQILSFTKANSSGLFAGVAGSAQDATDKVNVLAQALAETGSLSVGQQGIADTLLAQGQSDALTSATQTFQELNSAAFDAIPGIDAVSGALSGYIDTLAAGGSLTDEQAAQLANLSGGADSSAGSMDALAGVVNTLGFEFFDSNTYGAELVNQIINLAIAQGSGAISGDQFAGSMSVLTGNIWAAATAAGAATPKLWAMLAALNALNAANGGAVAPGQVGGGIYTGQGPRPGLSPDFVRGQQIAEAAAARARLQADTQDRNTARAEQAKAAKAAEGAGKKAANDAQREFEKAATAAGKAFENVAKTLEGALRKVDGLFSASKVTQEDMNAAKAGTYKNKADEYLRQFRDLAENGVKREGINPQDVKDALNRVGVKASDDLKTLAQQFEAAWNDSSLFADKANLKFINKGAVDVTLNLQAKVKEGEKNILEYFGATVDAVKEKFKAGDPGAVSAVAAELGDSNDKNIRELGASLKDGGQKIIDKVLALAQTSIDKSVAGLDLGDGVAYGGGGGGGGLSGIASKISGVVDKAREKVAAVAAGTKDFLAGVDLGASGDVSGIFKITGYDISTANPLSGPFKITSFDTTGLTAPTVTITPKLGDIAQTDLDKLFAAIKTPTVTITDVHAGPSVGADIQSDIATSLALQVENFKSNGAEIVGAIVLGAQGTDKDRGQGNGFGDAIINKVGDGLQARTDTLKAQGATVLTTIMDGAQGTGKDRGQGNAFGDAIFHFVGDGLQARQASFTAQGKSVTDAIKAGMATMATDSGGKQTSVLDAVAANYILDLRAQFGTRADEFKAIGATARNNLTRGLSGNADSTATPGAAAQTNPADGFIATLKTQFEAADFSPVTSIVSQKINSAFAPQKQEVSPGISVFTSAFDFTGMAESATRGLSTAFGTQTDIYMAMGDTAAVYIGFGFTDHDFSGSADSAITSLISGFANEANTTQLSTVGSNIADSIHNAFTGRIQTQDWMGTITSAIVASVMNGLADSLKSSGAPAGVK